MRKLVPVALALALAVVLVVTTVGCGPPPEKQITVGNKNFTEEYIIGQMMKQLLEDRGFNVSLTSGLSTTLLRQGMEAGDIDICADYTGTAWLVHLAHVYEPTGHNELYEMVKQEDAGNNFVWLDPMWNHNAYVLVSWAEFAANNSVETLSDLAALYRQEEGKITTYVGFEFSTRPDGLPALKALYNFTVDAAYLLTGVPGLSTLGLENHECDVAMAFGTDAIIGKYGWHVYTDDLSFWPPYDLTPYVRAEVLDEYPEIEDILNELVATFPGGGEAATAETVSECQQAWQALNARVDIDKLEPDEAAHEWLVQNGLIEE